MVLEEIASGECLPISQDRGPHARGCSLDVGQLLAAMQLVRAQLASRPDLLVLNKFGKTEAEGGGFRELIAEAIEEGISVLIAVPWRNIESWRLFTGGASREIVLGEGRWSAEDLAPAIERRLPCGVHHPSPDDVRQA